MKLKRSPHLFLTALLASAATVFAAETKPNILLILTDDIGWGDFQCYNPHGKIPTPNIDNLARTGMKFTDAHTPAALCSPTRYSMLTGNYPWRGRAANGVWDFDGGTYFLPGQQTIGHLLQASGYRTAMFGKINVGGVFEHVGDTREVDWTKPMTSGPIQWGFEYSYISSGGHALPPFLFLENNRVAGDPAKVMQLKKKRLPGGGMIPQDGPGLPDFDSSKIGELLATRAAAFLDDHLAKNKAAGEARPFYMHFCTDGIHNPWTPADTLLGHPLKGASKMTAHTDMVIETDILLGALVGALEQRGLLADTLIVFTSDNGGQPFEREFGHDAVGGLRGCKSFIYEGGHRVPFLVRWGDGTTAGSKIPPGSVSRQLIGTHDTVATFAELAGVKPGANQAVDSVSLLPVLRGDDRPVRQHLLIQGSPNRDALAEPLPEPGQSYVAAYAAVGRNYIAAHAAVATKGKPAKSPSDHMPHALREGAWKLTLNIADQPAALHNLDEDLAEQKNLIAEPLQAERVKRMEQLYRKLRAAKRTVPVHE
ncbi:MAG: arylsulfatase [Limisphaerales bacterium]